MIAHRVRCERMKKGCLHTTDPKDRVKVEGLQVSVGAHASPYQEAEGSAMEG